MKSSYTLGQESELIACQYLKNNGLKLVAKNYRCQLGEIDLIMREKNTLAFVEVRSRKHNSFGGAINSITQKKQHRIQMTAEHYLQENPKQRILELRFDFVGISRTNSNTETNHDIKWIKDAFRIE